MAHGDTTLPDLQASALKAYQAILLARAFDTKISSLYKAGKITGGVYLGRGHEAIAACGGVFLTAGYDVIAPFIREQAARVAWGEPSLRRRAPIWGPPWGT